MGNTTSLTICILDEAKAMETHHWQVGKLLGSGTIRNTVIISLSGEAQQKFIFYSPIKRVCSKFGL